MKQLLFFFLTLFLMGAGFVAPVFAADDSSSAAAETLNSETHPALKLAPDKSELIHLDRDAASVVVGNPNHIAVMLDTPRLAVVIPRTEGATYFSVLDKKGNVIMQRHVIVAGPKKNYIRVRRSCANVADGKECQPTSVYFCPDMCHEVKESGADDGGSSSTMAPPQ